MLNPHNCSLVNTVFNAITCTAIKLQKKIWVNPYFTFSREINKMTVIHFLVTHYTQHWLLCASRFAFQVQNVVLQIFVNKDLHPELRMVSWIVLFETKPSLGLVITLSRALQKEPNLQVASLVYSHMKSLTKEHIPWVCSYVSLLFTNIFQHRCLKLEHLKSKPVFFSAAACNVAIKILSPKLDKLSFLYSKAIFLDGYECKKVPLIYQWCFMPGDGFVWKLTD